MAAAIARVKARQQQAAKEPTPIGTTVAPQQSSGNEDSRKAAVIDPGGDAAGLQAFINRENLTVEYIINTHGHIDHIMANLKLKQATGALAPNVRRQKFWDSRAADLVEGWPRLGLRFRRRFCGAASADVRGSGA